MFDIQQGLAQVNKEIDKALLGAGTQFNKVTQHLVQSKGKGVRALLLLTVAENNGQVPKDAVLAAAAIELLHMATLIHDDVMDNAKTRRGIQTIHEKYDTKTAVITGDMLLSMSLSMLVSLDSHRGEGHEKLAPRLINSLTAVCKGEYNQHINNGNLDMGLLTYLQTISGKTAALFFISAYAGAILNGSFTQDESYAIGRFGRGLGMIFQIIDDCKDYEWSEDMALKPVGNDIKMGVVTLPLLLAMGKDATLKAVAKEFINTQKDTRKFVKLVKNAGGTRAARAMCARFVTKAEKAIATIAPDKKNALLGILHSVEGV